MKKTLPIKDNMPLFVKYIPFPEILKYEKNVHLGISEIQ